MTKSYKIILACLAVILCVASLTACGKDGRGTKVIFTTGTGKDEIFRIEDEICRKEELLVYLVNTQNQYENVYGTSIWSTEHNGVTLEENVKETVLARIAQIKTMYLMAKDRGIELTEKETSQVQKAARAYFNSLNETEKEVTGATFETIEELYRELVMAQKVYDMIIKDINPEISDDEARIITVQHILIKTYNLDGEGNRIVYSDKDKAEAALRASEIREKVSEGKKSFEELATQYSQDKNITYSFGKGEMDPAFEEAAFLLEKGQISEVIESGSGYHIIKCITTFDREETDANKMKIIEQRKNQAFGQEYDAFVATLVRQLNENLWEQITLIREDQVTTCSFFDIYNQYLLDD